MPPAGTERPHGQVRQSQVVTTFGPGSLLDLPNHSVIVGGLDHWTEAATRSTSRGWSRSSSELLDVPALALLAPAARRRRPDVDPEDRASPPGSSPSGSSPRTLADGDRAGRPARAAWSIASVADQGQVHRPTTGSRSPVVPVRFVRACRKGHIGDIDWYASSTSGDDRLPAAALDRRARHQRRPGRGLGPLRVQAGAAADRGDQARASRRWATATAAGPGSGRTRRSRATSRTGCWSARRATPTSRRR